MRLLLISLGTLVFVGMVLLMTRFWGLSQPYQAFDHSFLKATQPWKVVKVVTADEAKLLLNRTKEVIFWLDLSKTKDHQFLVLDPSRNIKLTPEVLKENFLSDKIFAYDLKFLRIYFDKEPTLTDFLSLFPESKFILNLVDNAPDVHTSLVEQITKLKADERVLIQSDIEIVLKSIKELKPLWLFGTSRSDSMRLLTFDSIGLGPASPFKGDVFISPMKIMNRAAFNDSVLAEMKRRKKLVVLGPLKSEQEIIDARSLSPDGYIYENSHLFMKELD